MISRRELKLRFLNIGASRAYHAPNGGEFALLQSKQDPLTIGTPVETLKEHSIDLSPKDRFVLVSDGFIESCGGDKSVLKLLNTMNSEEPKKLLNELGFLTKGHISDDEMPAQDCTAIIVDLEGQKLRMV